MVYMSAEVSHDWNGQDVTVSAGDIEHIHIQYPNYERHDCEARTICFHMGWEGGTNSREISLTAFIKKLDEMGRILTPALRRWRWIP